MLLLVQGANYIIPLITFPYLLRVLGAGQFGTLVLSQALMGYAVLLSDYGFNLSATRRAAEHRADRVTLTHLFWNVLATKAVLAVTALLVLIGIVSMGWVAVDIGLLVMTAPMLLGSVLMPQWLFQGLECMGWISVCQIAARAVAIPLTFLLVKVPEDLTRAALISSSVTVISGFAALVLVWKLGFIGPVKVSLRKMIEQLRDSWHLFLSSASVSLYTSTNQLLVGVLSGTQQLGYFAAADRIRMACTGLLMPLSSAVYPRVSATMASQPDAAFRLIRWTCAVQLTVTLSVAAVLLLKAEWIVSIVMGPGYEAAIPMLRWLALLPAVVALSNTLGMQTMLPLGMNRQFSRILLGSGLLNILLLPLFIHFFGGVGAAMSALITESVVVAVMAWTLRELLTQPFRQTRYAS